MTRTFTSLSKSFSMGITVMNKGGSKLWLVASLLTHLVGWMFLLGILIANAERYRPWF